MAKFWNFICFQLGWFACVWGAANKELLWAIVVTVVYIAFHVWRSPSPKVEMRLLLKVLLFGITSDTLIMYLGLLNFRDDWLAPYLSPLWMWVLWVLVGTTVNGSLIWLRSKPILGAILGAICGPISYEAGIRMGAGGWGAGQQVAGFILVGVIWGIAIPLFFYWNRDSIECGPVKNL